MPDLTTKYLGLTLKSPLVVSPSPLSTELDNLKKMEDAGAGAIVLHSLFEEQLLAESDALDEALWQGREHYAESLSFFPDKEDYRLGPESYLELLAKAKQTLSIPVMGSLNGVSEGGWIDYAKKMEDAGADAIELNVYYIPTQTGRNAAAVEQVYEDLVRSVVSSVKIPVAVKVGPYFSAMANMSEKLCGAGAKGLVLFNRFYQPDFDLNELEVTRGLNLSDSTELLLRLRWVAILFERVACDFAVTGGVHTGEDVIKSMMAGARVAMTTSALLKRGIGHLKTLEEQVTAWMEEHEYDSIEMMQGSMSQRSVGDPAAFERANYMRILTEYTPSSELQR
jgi:dihydroorotate dehydrogenase (fumarate)